ncbi:MAG TPA: gamma-glutamyl-gamma-aminobutyrate hydrolase family protein [Thermoanaerobaculaceae bacterium]|nr:gamma-glutamyl-gamma-aminobutyrate hydrolase family protein [Thermoanaerobaculaceae bacterium]
MKILVTRSDHRPFEVDRFGAAWRRAGGDPSELVFVTPAAAGDVAACGGACAGLLLTGGPDVEPARYGAAPEPGVELHPDPARDGLDLDLLARAAREEWPVLAVCYGIQVLNVFHGGTLVQDLDRAGKGGHRAPEPKDRLAHTVARRGGRWLDGCPGEFWVNSRHHQAVGRLAGALEVVAAAPDGVIEAVELRSGERFVLGVQWHPENLTQPEHVAVFRAFRSACSSRGAAPGLRSVLAGPRTTDHGDRG